MVIRGLTKTRHYFVGQQVVRWKPGAREKAERGNQAAAGLRRLQLLALRLRELIVEDKKQLLNYVAENFPPKTKTLPVEDWGTVPRNVLPVRIARQDR